MCSQGVRLHSEDKWERDSPAEGPAWGKAPSLRSMQYDIPWPRNSPPGKVSQGSDCRLFLIAPRQKQVQCPARGDRFTKFWCVQGISGCQLISLKCDVGGSDGHTHHTLDNRGRSLLKRASASVLKNEK